MSIKDILKETTFIYELSDMETLTPFYIGKSNSPIKRKYFHKKEFGKNIILNVLDEVYLKEWVFWEKYYIELYYSWGFNLKNKNKGGNGPLNWSKEKKLQHSKKFKDNNHSKYYTKEIRGKMSKGCMGKSNFAGKNHTLSSRNKISKSNLGKEKHTPISKRDISKGMKEQWKTNINLKNRFMLSIRPKIYKPVFQYNLNDTFIKEWESIKEASEVLNINRRGISNCLIKLSLTSGGYIWKYKNEK